MQQFKNKQQPNGKRSFTLRREPPKAQRGLRGCKLASGRSGEQRSPRIFEGCGGQHRADSPMIGIPIRAWWVALWSEYEDTQ